MIMKRLSLVLIVALIVSIFAACTGNVEIADGTYRAEYADFDATGWKDFVEITFVDGEVTEVVADAISGKDGSLKSESVELSEDMEKVEGTYPAKYYQDLVNQYMQNPDINSVDVVAHATRSSNSFIYLLSALEKSIRSGDTETVIVQRPTK